VKVQGRRGEVAVAVHSDIPERFRLGMKLEALAEDGSRRELEIEDLWPHKGQLVMKFAGVDSISDAERLRGCELQVPQDQRAQLEPGWTYVSDLIGCTVFDSEREIGVIRDVEFGTGEAPQLVVQGSAARFEIPYAEAFLKSVDLGRKRIVMSLPEGLLEVNAPLTEDEKRELRNPGSRKGRDLGRR
jgi:16S rRNA processing protein RimM